MSELRSQAIALVRGRGYERRDQPFKLASGQMSHDYVDGKFAVDSGQRLALVSRAVIELAEQHDIRFNAAGGLTMGADALAHGVALLSGCDWFSVRKEPKPRGRSQWIEGARLNADHRVLLLDDVVSLGGSILMAYDKVLEAGSTVSGVVPMVDRGDRGREIFEGLGVPYVPLMTYRDLGIEPVRGPELAAAARQ